MAAQAYFSEFYSLGSTRTTHAHAEGLFQLSEGFNLDSATLPRDYLDFT